jgi:hypothetical protein
MRNPGLRCSGIGGGLDPAHSVRNAGWKAKSRSRLPTTSRKLISNLPGNLPGYDTIETGSKWSVT